MSIMRAARRVVVSVAGAALVLAGAAMLVLPGPGTVVILAGLGLLATEFTWAARLMGWIRGKGRDVLAAARRRLTTLRRS